MAIQECFKGFKARFKDCRSIPKRFRDFQRLPGAFQVILGVFQCFSMGFRGIPWRSRCVTSHFMGVPRVFRRVQEHSKGSCNICSRNFRGVPGGI